MWFVIGLIVVLLFTKLDAILEALKAKDPAYQEKILNRQKLEVEERQAMLRALKDMEGRVCTIKSSDLIYTHQNSVLKARILEVDETWVRLEYASKKLKKTSDCQEMLFKTSSIESFSSQV